MKISDFEIPANSTKREWTVYVIVARPTSDKVGNHRFFYIGKTGDNREGCNPIISRIGNHFSFNKIHSQIRNYLKQHSKNTTDYNYTVFYATFGEYNIKDKESKDRVNELERQLKRYMQEKLQNRLELLNQYKDSRVSKNEKLKREKILTENDKETLKLLVDKAIK